MPYEKRDGKPLYQSGKEPLLSSIGLKESTATICNECAENGHVPFETDKYGIRGQCKPWTWYPWKAGVKCSICTIMC